MAPSSAFYGLDTEGALELAARFDTCAGDVEHVADEVQAALGSVELNSNVPVVLRSMAEDDRLAATIVRLAVDELRRHQLALDGTPPMGPFRDREFLEEELLAGVTQRAMLANDVLNGGNQCSIDGTEGHEAVTAVALAEFAHGERSVESLEEAWLVYQMFRSTFDTAKQNVEGDLHASVDDFTSMNDLKRVADPSNDYPEHLRDAAAVILATAEADSEFKDQFEQDPHGVWGFFVGAWDATWAIGEFIHTIDPSRAIFDPTMVFSDGWGAFGNVDGYASDMKELGEGLYAFGDLAVHDPVAAGALLVDVETLKDNPARWFGQLAPDVVAAVFTAGTGTAATRGTSASARIANLTTRFGARHGDDLTTTAARFGDDVAGAGGPLDNTIGAFDDVAPHLDDTVLPADALTGGMFRRTSNIGRFTPLLEPMQLRHVRRVAREAGIGLDGIRIKIVRDSDLIGRNIFGYTPPGGRAIHLYPDAFSNREQLVRTLGHERTHVFQEGLYGTPTDSIRLREFERAASQIEDSFWDFDQWTGGR